MNKATKEEKEVLEKYLLQFLNIEKQFPLLPGIKDQGTIAALMGIDVAELTDLRTHFDENARQAAVELLEDEEVSYWLDQLPFLGNETIVALGDSMTDDRQGWFSILCNVLDIAVPDADFKFINSGISYNTTTDALKRLNRDVLAHNPDWVFIALGTFDMQRLDVAPHRTLTSLADYWENIKTMETVLMEKVDNPLVWITPPPVISDMMDEMPLFNFKLYEKDLHQVREILFGKQGYIIDPKGTRMGDEQPEAWNYLSDGLHPSLSGHVNTVKEVLRHITQTKAPEGGRSMEPPEDFD